MTDQGTLLGPLPQAGEGSAWMFTGGTRLPTTAPTHRKAAPQTTQAAARCLPWPSRTAYGCRLSLHCGEAQASEQR